MADFPASIFTPRTTANQPGITYDPTKTKIQFAEDYSLPAAEIAAIEAVLGTNPNGAYATVKAWLEALAAGGAVGVGNLYHLTADLTIPTNALYLLYDILIIDAGVVLTLDTDAIVQLLA